MIGINTNFGSIRLYSGKSYAASYVNDGTFSSLISDAQKTTENNKPEYDFSDMYIRTYQTTLDVPSDKAIAYLRMMAEKGFLEVPVATDLKELMESIEKGTDYATVRSQADDLATFIRYTVFKKDTDDPEKVSALLSELKKKQAGYDTSRFMPIFHSGGKQGKKNLEYWLNLLGTDWDGGFNSEDERTDAADELLKILEKRNSSKADEDNNLQEAIDQMKAENIGKSNVTKTVLHNALFKMY